MCDVPLVVCGQRRNLNLAVLVLLAPPVSIFCTIFFIAYRHRKR